jgi:hypothetical protein
MKDPIRSEAARQGHANRSPEEREATRLKQSDAAVMQMFTRPHKPGNPLGGTPGNAGYNAVARAKRASILKIAREVATTHEEDIRQAILDGIHAPPPRSFPYLALLFDRLEGKAVDATTMQEMNSTPQVDLTQLTTDQLRERVLQIAKRLTEPEEPPVVIDAEVVPNLDDMTLEQLQEEVRIAQAESDRANEEARRAANAVAEANEEVARLRGKK